MDRTFVARILLPALAVLLAGCVASRPTGPDPPVDAGISVVTFNLFHDKADWPRRRERIVDELRTLRPDAILLQEVLQHEALRNQAEDLGDALGYATYFVSADPPERVRRYGNAILVRHRVLARDQALLRPLDDYRVAAHVRIAVDGHEVDLYATHLSNGEGSAGAGSRREQVGDLLAFVARSAGDGAAIIGGDFNTSADQPELAAIAGAFDNAWDRLHAGEDASTTTRTTLNPHWFPDDARRIDHVYLRRGALAPLEASSVLDRADAEGTWPSDHFGVYVRAAFATGGGERLP